MYGRMCRLMAASIAAASLTLGLVATTASAATTRPASGDAQAVTRVQRNGHLNRVTVRTSGVRLTASEARALRRALAGRTDLSRTQAQRVVNRVLKSANSEVRPNAWGSGSSSGACGTAVLQGDSYGRWNFSLSFNTEVVGVATVGGVTVSTNALLGADSKGFGVSGSYVYHDSLRDGMLSSIGWGATADTLSGWALTSGAWWCGIDVAAPWQF